jgi:hypothetical protein
MTPDIARSQLGVQTFHVDVQSAVDENNITMTAVVNALIQSGIAEKDIKTAVFHVMPRREYRPDGTSEVVGYDVSNTVSVTMRELPKVGSILQSALNAGANQVYGIDFTVEDPEPSRQQARDKAIENARTKAESMAKTSGVTLGKALSISESSYGGPSYVRAEYDKVAAATEVPVQPGELEITVTVSIVYDIK